MQEIRNGIWREIASRIRLDLSAEGFGGWFAAIALMPAINGADPSGSKHHLSGLNRE